MKLEEFTYKGKKYQVDKVIKLDPEAGKKMVQIITRDGTQFKLAFNETIFKWQIIESSD